MLFPFALYYLNIILSLTGQLTKKFSIIFLCLFSSGIMLLAVDSNFILALKTAIVDPKFIIKYFFAYIKIVYRLVYFYLSGYKARLGWEEYRLLLKFLAAFLFPNVLVSLIKRRAMIISAWRKGGENSV